MNSNHRFIVYHLVNYKSMIQTIDINIDTNLFTSMIQKMLIYFIFSISRVIGNYNKLIQP